jgi:hypothetical protein
MIALSVFFVSLVYMAGAQATSLHAVTSSSMAAVSRILQDATFSFDGSCSLPDVRHGPLHAS